MKRFVVLMLAFVLCLPVCVLAADAVYERDRASEVTGWSLYGADDDVDTTAQLITELNTTYAQLAAEDKLEVLSDTISDTQQKVTIEGIDNTSKRIKETVTLNSTIGTTEVTTTANFRYVDQAYLSSSTAAGTITIRRATGNTFITSIPAGEMEAMMSQHFNGEKDSYITMWGAGISSTLAGIIFDLRYYNDDARCLAPTTGYRVLDRITTDNSTLGMNIHSFEQPIKCPKDGWIAIYGTGGANDADGEIIIQGYDTAN